MKIPFIVTLSTLLVLLPSSRSTAEHSADDQQLRAIMKKLDRVLERIDDLEQRISSLENTVIVFEEFRPDSRGVLYDSSGHKVGIWGVDVPRNIP
jgi:hypothetical protein